MRRQSVEYNEVIQGLEEGYQILVEKAPPLWGTRDPATEKQLSFLLSLHQEVGKKFAEVSTLFEPLLVAPQLLLTKRSASMMIEIYKYLG